MGKLDSTRPLSFSFSGCGFLGLYHVGVASCLKEYGPLNSSTRYLGASAGSLAAMFLVCDLPLGDSTTEILHVAMRARARALGPFHPSFDVNRIIYESLSRVLPDDCHIRANGRLYISVTRISDGKNVIINKFKSKDELIKAIQCSCFIPLWSGFIPPKFNGISYIDGGCTDNLPLFDENTVTVSPFSGESDICPQDDTYNLFQVNLANTSIALTPANFFRVTRILFPAHPEMLSKMCQQGFDDCLKYLQRNNQISCTRCLAIHFTLEKEENQENRISTKLNKRGEKHFHPDRHSMENCRDCEYRRKIAVVDSLPEAVVLAIQDACDQVNKGIINWLFRHKPMKLLSILSIPALLPIDMTIWLLLKIYEKMPDIKRELKESFVRFITLLQSLLVKIEDKKYSAKFSCQLAVKEFDYAVEEGLTKIRKSSSSSYLKSNPSYKTMIFDKNSEEQKPTNLEKSRKTSYAGYEVNKNINRQCQRRNSMIEIGDKTTVLPPERIISQLNFDFKLDVKDGKTPVDNADNSIGNDSLNNKVLDIDFEDIDQSNAIEIANKALDWEKEILEKCQDRLDDNEGNFDKIFEITRKNEVLMAYYYTDENNKVKFTELFKIKDEDLKKPDDNIDYDDVDQQLQQEPNELSTYKDSDDGLLETTPISGSTNSINDCGLTPTNNSTSPTKQSESSPETSKKKHRKSYVLVD